MSFYFIYDLPNWLLGVGVVTVFLAGSLLGLVFTRPLVRKLLRGSGVHNDIVSFFFAGIGVFYGLALGLIAVGTWENYSDVDSVVSNEAAATAALYRDFDAYPAPVRNRLEGLLRDYTRKVINEEWPAHRRGEANEGADEAIDTLENAIMAHEPRTESEKIGHAEVLRSLDELQDQRRLRLQSVSTGLPAALWSVVIIGAILNIAITYLFWLENRWLHAFLIAILAVFIGLLVFLTAAMDNPFRGEFSVSPDALQSVFDKVMSRTS